MPWYRQLHWQIVIGMVLGTLLGVTASLLGWGDFVAQWIKPFGTIFINLLKLAAMPMIIVSLVTGIASLSDLTKLSRIGGKTIAIYLATTVLAVIIGLLLVSIIKPGSSLPEDMRQQLEQSYSDTLAQRASQAEQVKKSGPLQFIVDIVPENVINAFSDNRLMLQMVFIALLLGIGLVKSDKEKTQIIIDLFSAANELVLKIVEMIMLIAPIGVFAQISTVITELADKDPVQALMVLKTLGVYLGTVIIGLSIQTFLVYGGMLKFFTSISFKDFFKAMRPVQLIAFSTSSSAATLPVTMECCEKELKIPEEITSFTLPVGATVNMDGTSLFQAVSVVFIAQIIGYNLTLMDQLAVILTTLLASIGTAGVPGAGVVMLVIVLQSINIPIEGIVLILGVERIIDMFRTVTNVTGDAVVTAMVAKSEESVKT